MKSNTILSLTVVLELLTSTNAAPIAGKRAPVKRQDAQICPGILQAPSVGVDFACASQLWPLCVARQAEGDQRREMPKDIASGSVTTPAVPYPPGATPEAPNAAIVTEEFAVTAAEGVNVDSTGSSPSEAMNVQDATATLTVVDGQVQGDATGPQNPEVTSLKTPIGDAQAVEVVAVVPETQTPAPVTEAPIPAVDAFAPVAEAPAPVAVDGSAPALVATAVDAPGPIAEAPVLATVDGSAPAPVAEAPVPAAVGGSAPAVAEAPAPVAVDGSAPAAVAKVPVPAAVEAPVPAAVPAEEEQMMSTLAAEKEQFRVAFEEEQAACSKELAIGEQDPLVNLYMIEKAAHSAKCSAHSH
ncbi:hypothetical protein BGX34_006507 [Mortierella sp. NVP85]|nr:hypothetical protein BGX34_006507 [Mortierella sp. NVP85]